MSDPKEAIYNFGAFKLDAAERTLFNGVNAVPLAPKIFDTLLILVENAGRVISKEKLLAEIWDDSFVEENNLAQNISALRRVFGKGSPEKFIETVPKFGYRFLAPVTRSVDLAASGTQIFERTRARIYIDDGETRQLTSHTAQEASAGQLKSAVPETHYVRNGDVNIAYQVLGDGPVDIVFVMGWVSHLEYFWKHHLFASFLFRLASFSRLILFDKRGTGLSDRVPINELPTLEQRMEDVHAVMDAVGSRQAVLVGVSEGGPMCSLFAATYPERTKALVMIGTYAKRLRDDDYPWAPTNEQREAFLDLMQREWGGPVGIDERAPSMAADEEFREWWATYLRMGASPGAAVALTKMNAEIDVRNVLPSIRVPTLVIHRSGDLCLKVEEGRFVASKIPGSKYIELDGIDHLPFVGEQDEILDAIEEFLSDIREADEYDRVLATVLCVRLADVNRSKSSPDFSEQAKAYFRRQFEIFKGRESAYGSGEILATFDGPARAIRCASAVAESAGKFRIPVKTGLHTGECDLVADRYSGFAVELARRIADECEPGRVLASRTVKDLVAGSGIIFDDLGIRNFDGIDGGWRLFSVNA
jgi:pimeloyl-ACP methyl ester carboxylesterase/DNA-binding winged helix-turn-helix (wHTH) protein